MSDIIENKPRRRRVVRGGESLLATSNETKMKDKARVVEKKATPLFQTAKSIVAEKISEIVADKSEKDDVVMFANPLPAEEKPKKTRTSRKATATQEEEKRKKSRHLLNRRPRKNAVAAPKNRPSR